MPAKRFSNHISDDEVESELHSFVVKIWLDNLDRQRGTPKWRGHITHVTDAKRRYIQHVVDITTFILPYLQEMGVKINFYWRFVQWLSRRRKQ